MANLTHGSDSWTGSNTQNSKQQTYKFSTAGKYSDKDISLTVTAKLGSAKTPTASGASTSTSLSGTTLTVARSVTPSVTAGWVDSGTAGTVTITGTVPTQTKTVTSSTSSQTVSPDSGKLLSKVTVNAISPQNSSGVSSTAVGTNTSKTENKVWVDFPYGWHPLKSGSSTSATIYLVDSQIGTAAQSEVLSGKTFTSSNGAKLSGTMTNQGAKTASLNCGGSYTIPAGYHNGLGKITANSLASQTSATATASQIVSGQTAWVGGTKITGTLANGDDVYY